MATRRSRSTTPAASKQTQQVQDTKGVRLRFEYRDITDIVPYEYNARDNSKAIEVVAKSIENFGFIVPCVIDDDGVLVAGHTRVEAAKLLNITEVPVVYASHLTPEQVMAFRLVDNKTAEVAEWEIDLLSREISILADSGFDMSGYGWSSEEIDCLRSVVSDDCLSPANLVTPEERETIGRAERRAPATTRIVIGEFVFFVPQSSYRSWADGIRSFCEFDEDRIAEELSQRLGLPR